MGQMGESGPTRRAVDEQVISLDHVASSYAELRGEVASDRAANESNNAVLMELKEEVASLQEENARLAEELKTKRDFLDKVLNTVDNFKEEVQAIEEEEVDPDKPYDNASEASTEIITELLGGRRDATTPAAERRQSRDFGRRMTASSIRRSSRQGEFTPKANPRYVKLT